MNQKIIMVDIDDTLWDFHEVMEGLIAKEFGKTMKESLGKVEWNSWEKLMTHDQFFGLCHYIHMRQHLYEPYKEAEKFLKALKDLGFYIIITSHRRKESSKSTKDFLKKNNLIYDELILSWDKTVLFNKLNIFAVVDDCPHVLEKALEKNLLCTGLKFDHNEYIKIPLFNNLNEVLDFLKENVRIS